jgi:uncharacterized protein (DUF2252 family)
MAKPTKPAKNQAGKVPAPAAKQRVLPRQDSEAGRAARRAVPRTSLGAWQPAQDRPDPVTTLVAQEADRVPDLIPLRHERMAASAFSFYRGAAAVMAEDLRDRPGTGLIVQLAGDAHLANFGGFATAERSMVFDLNDFDETLPGPFEWDVLRLVASFEIAARHRGFTPEQRAGIVREVADEYCTAMAEFAAMTRLDVWYSRMQAEDILTRWAGKVDAAHLARFNDLIAKGRRKTSARAVSRYTEIGPDGELRIIADPPFVVPVGQLTDTDDDRVRGHIGLIMAQYRDSVDDDRKVLLDGYRVVDVARKVVGVGSVGTRCWIALLVGQDNSGDDLVLQFKEAGPSVLEVVAPRSRYDNHGERVVQGQRLMQSSSDMLLGWTSVIGLDGVSRDYYVRQMWDWKTSADLETMDLVGMRVYARICGWTLARAHARSGNRFAISAYLGSGTAFGAAMNAFAVAYADQNQRDYEAFLQAIDEGRIERSDVESARR